MNCAKDCFWSPSGEYICNTKYKTLDTPLTNNKDWVGPIPIHVTKSENSKFGYGNWNKNVDNLEKNGVAYWQDGQTQKLIQPKSSYPVFPKKRISGLYFPNTFNFLKKKS